VRRRKRLRHNEIIMVRWIGLLALGCAIASAQTVCPPTPEYSPCDLVFDIPGAPTTKPIDLAAEFRSPRASTFLAHAFWDGGTRWVIRYFPAEPGTHVFRLLGSVAGYAGKQGEMTAAAGPVNHPGLLRTANLHHFAWVDGINYTPSLYMGGVVPDFPAMDFARWKALVDERAAEHFNHLGVTLVDSRAAADFRSPEFFRAAEEKIAYANQHGIMIDLAFFGPDLLTKLLPAAADRRAWFTDALSRLAGFDVMWQGIEGWENYDNGRDLLKEIADYLKELDPYKHLATTRTLVTSAPLFDDGWMQVRSYQTADDTVGAVEQQVYQGPAINNFSAGDQGADAFRHHLWNATMDGQYPDAAIPDAPIPDAQAAATAMKVWFEFMESTRHWELEPFFDVENGRGLQLEGIEYVIYVENPGPMTVTVEKHGYDVEWIDPATGARAKVKDPCKNDTCVATPPSAAHDWVLHISRESTKAGMLKSVKFVSRDEELKLQEIEGDPAKSPFELTAPDMETLSLAKPAAFSVKLKRQSKALQHMSWLWTGEVTAAGRGYRVIATGADGTFRIPANIAEQYPAALHIRLYAMNGLGKVYALDRNYTLTK
jgi:hypothetical protein